MNRIEQHWADYLRNVVPLAAPVLQVRESKRAFYAGALCLLTEITSMLDPGEEATEADLKKMDEIDAELRDFAQRVAAGAA